MGSGGLTRPPQRTAQGLGLCGGPASGKQRNEGRYLLMKRRQRLCGGHSRLLLGARAEPAGRRAGCWGCLSLGSPCSRPEGLGAPACTLGTGGHSHVAVRTQDKERPFEATEGGHSGRPDSEAAIALQRDPLPRQDTGAGGTPTPSLHPPLPRHQTPRARLGGWTWAGVLALPAFPYSLAPPQTLGASVSPSVL